MKTIRSLSLLSLLVSALALAAAGAESPVKLRMSINDPLIPILTESLGHFAQEGLEIIFVKVESLSPEDYLMQEPLVNGRLDVSCHWFQHVAFGARHNLPDRKSTRLNSSHRH